MPTVKYWYNLEKCFRCKIRYSKIMYNWNACFTSLGTIGGNLLTRHPKNINRVHKYRKDIMSVIITLGIDVNGGETVFYGIIMNDIGKIAHVINDSNLMCVVGAFDLKKSSIYSDWTHIHFILYPTQINISSLSTSWY